MPQQGLPNIDQYKVMPVLVTDFDLMMDAAKQTPGAFDIDGIEAALNLYKERGFLVGGVHNRPEVGAFEETEQRYIAEVKLVLTKFKNNPFSWVKACYYDEELGQGPFARRSLLRLPDYGLLVMVEAEAWGAGMSLDWGASFVVALSPVMQEFAKRAGLPFKSAADVFVGG